MSFSKLSKEEQKKRYAQSSKNWDQAWVNFPIREENIVSWYNMQSNWEWGGNRVDCRPVASALSSGRVSLPITLFLGGSNYDHYPSQTPETGPRSEFSESVLKWLKVTADDYRTSWNIRKKIRVDFETVIFTWWCFWLFRSLELRSQCSDTWDKCVQKSTSHADNSNHAFHFFASPSPSPASPASHPNSAPPMTPINLSHQSEYTYLCLEYFPYLPRVERR